jgi:ribose transport system substrate-binding protein
MIPQQLRVTRRLATASAVIAAVFLLAACSSASVGSQSSAAPTTSAKNPYASIIPSGDVVAASKTLVAQNQKGTNGFTPPSVGAKAQKPGATIAYVASDLTDGGVTGVREGVKQAAAAIGWNVTEFDGQGTVAGHTTAMGQAIASHPAAIVLGSVDAVEQASTIKQATEAGIPVFGWHSTAAPGAGAGLKTNITTNPLRVAQLAGAFAVANSNGKAGAVIMTDSQYSIAIEKSSAVAAYIKSCKTCSVLETVDSPIAATAQDMPGIISAALQKYGSKFTYLIGINGQYFSGAAPALQAAGKAPAGPPYGIAAGDGVASEFQRIRSSQYQTATVAEPLYLQGWQLVDAINDSFAGKSIPKFVADPALIDKNNVPTTDVFDPDSGYRNVYKKIWGK